MREDVATTSGGLVMHEAGDEQAQDEQEREPPRQSAVLRTIDAAKRHPVVVVAVTVVAVATFFTTAGGLIGGVVDFVDDRANPRRELYAQVDALKLDVTPEYVDRVLGPPESVIDPDAECAECEALSLRVYPLEGGLAVRALFEGSTLGMFLVTRVEEDARPRIRWQGTSQGSLGDASFAEASALGGDGTITPTDAVLLPGAQRITYVEVFALGAPGNYEGLLLGYSTEGVSEAPLDLGAAEAFADTVGSTSPPPPDAADFRQESRPNTFGAFRDDGLMGELVRDADFAASLLIAGTFT